MTRRMRRYSMKATRALLVLASNRRRHRISGTARKRVLMTRPVRSSSLIWCIRLRAASALALALVLLLVVVVSQSAQAQTYEVLHSFTGSDGAQPFAGLVQGEGEFYGTTYSG